MRAQGEDKESECLVRYDPVASAREQGQQKEEKKSTKVQVDPASRLLQLLLRFK